MSKRAEHRVARSHADSLDSRHLVSVLVCMRVRASKRQRGREREIDTYIYIYIGRERERAKNASISAKLRPIHWDGEHEVV